jgi:ornithine cyclodeaminase
MQGNRILYLSRNDLLAVGLLDYAAIVEDVRKALVLHTRGKTVCEKLALDLDVDKDWKISALVGVIGPYAGVKWLGANVDNRALGYPRSSSIIALNDRQTGKALCVMDGSLISALRTGAYTSLVTEVLGPPGPTCVGIVGAGVISRCVLLSMATVVRDRISRVLVHDLKPEYQERYAQLMGEQTGLSIAPVSDLGNLVRQSGITISATTAMAPLIKLADVRDASTYIHLGGWEDEKAYVAACAQPPNKIVCDDIDMVLHRNVQTVAYAFHDGLFGREAFYGNLGEILLGTKPGREGDEWIYFNAVGLPVLDVAVASRLFETALRENMGVLLGSQPPHWILTGDPL